MKKIHLTVCLYRHTHPSVVLFISLHHARIVKSESDSSQDIQKHCCSAVKERETERKRERERERGGGGCGIATAAVVR